jgi:hypothetical protein
VKLEREALNKLLIGEIVEVAPNVLAVCSRLDGSLRRPFVKIAVRLGAVVTRLHLKEFGNGAHVRGWLIIR